jgi:hypothetical protein
MPIPPRLRYNPRHSQLACCAPQELAHQLYPLPCSSTAQQRLSSSASAAFMSSSSAEPIRTRSAGAGLLAQCNDFVLEH